MNEFLMPSLGADMDAGTLVEWMVKPGDAVKRGQVVAVVETQKGAIEVEIWDEGVVERLVVEPGRKVPVGEVLALLRGKGEAAPPLPPPGSAPASAAATPVAPRPAPVRPGVDAASRARVSPSARKLAEDLGIPLESINPGAPGGVISRADVERAAGAQGPRPVPTSRDGRGNAVPGEETRAVAAGGRRPDWHGEMRKAIAAAMSRSKREIPHYYLSADIDATAVMEWLTAENLKRGVAERLLPVAPFMKAVALALRETPELNGCWTPAGFKPSAAIHLGMAIAMRGGGLVAPAIHDTDRLGLDELMAALRELTGRVRGGRLRSSEMSDPTVTLTSLGEQGVEMVLPVIHPPQVAIVGLGKVADRPRVVGGAVLARKVVTATLAADHRASDGHRGALFLSALAKLINNPEKLR
ncbi:MAG: 2-oxo acid dehydrogenase subunit E2 [Burkholderiales bacterium]|nr:2-oxo acid dehydrogenase subunit E2 [Burkholderiales bacterium]